MSKADGWRLQGQEKYLLNASLTHQNYQSMRLDWEHDHCEFCGEKFSLNIVSALKTGYSTVDKYHWICEKCFADFREKFLWTTVDT